MIFDGWRKAKEKSFRKGGDPYIENIFLKVFWMIILTLMKNILLIEKEKFL